MSMQKIGKRYRGNWWETNMGGHLSIGKVTIFGENAMLWAVNISTKKWGAVCFRLPFRCFCKWHPLYFYVSPNGTPWAATYYWGTGKNAKKQAERARQRKAAFGHNFDVWHNPLIREKLKSINDF